MDDGEEASSKLALFFSRSLTAASSLLYRDDNEQATDARMTTQSSISAFFERKETSSKLKTKSKLNGNALEEAILVSDDDDAQDAPSKKRKAKLLNEPQAKRFKTSHWRYSSTAREIEPAALETKRHERFKKKFLGLDGSLRKSDKSQLVIPKSSFNYTPLEKQYLKLKKENPEIMLIIEVGYKFMLFEENAVIASRLLNIAHFWSRNMYTASEYLLLTVDLFDICTSDSNSKTIRPRQAAFASRTQGWHSSSSGKQGFEECVGQSQHFV